MARAQTQRVKLKGKEGSFVTTPGALSWLAARQDLLVLLSAERARAAGVLELLGRQVWARGRGWEAPFGPARRPGRGRRSRLRVVRWVLRVQTAVQGRGL